MRLLLCILLLAGSVFAQDGNRIHRHKHYDTTLVEDFQKIRRRRLTTDVDSTGFAMYAWGDECFFKVQLRESGSRMNHYETGELNGFPYVEYGDNNLWYKMYMTEYGAFEYDAIIRKKPGGGRHSLTFGIETQGLRFCYQDTLSDIDKLDAYRPDSVIGSYAVYHSTRQGNVIQPNGVFEEYMTGKACHIFRPRAWDASGDTVWGFIEIDTVLDSVTIGVDPTWIANANYPVTIDPTFGFTGVGGTPSNANEGESIWGLGPYQSGSSGNADSISMYIGSGTGENITLGFYDDDTDYPDDLMGDGGGGVTAVGWNIQVLDDPVAITGSTPYWLAVGWSNNNPYGRYDTDSGIDREKKDFAYVHGTLVDPFPSGAGNSADRKYSIFVYYTAAGAGGWQGQVIPVSIQ